MKKLLITTTIELPKANVDQLHTLKDTVYIYYYQNYTLYKYLYETVVEEDSALYSTYDQRFFIHKENESRGYHFNELNMQSSSQMTVDSFLTQRSLKGLPLLIGENDSLVRKNTEFNQTVVEVYAAKEIKDESFNDTTYLSFSPKVKTGFSFSPDLDRIYNMKLIKIHLLYNRRFSQTNNTFLPKREWIFEMRELNKNHTQTDIDLCEKLIQLYNGVK